MTHYPINPAPHQPEALARKLTAIPSLARRACVLRRTENRASRQRLRRAASLFELLVAFTLLTTVLSVSAQMLVRHNRLLTAHRNYRVALDELSNQIDRLSVLPAGELPQAVSQLAPSAFATARLPGAELTGQLEPAEAGMHLILKLSWDESQRRHAPVSLATWVFAAPPAASPSIGSDTQ